MGMLRTVAEWFGLARADEPSGTPSGMSDGVRPPSRSGTGYVTPRRALSLGPVFRAMQVLQTAAMQLSLDVERTRAGVTEIIDTPSIVRRPDVESGKSRSAFIAETVTSLAATGNAFWRKTYSVSSAELISLKVLNPHEVTVIENLRGQIEYHHNGKVIPTREVQHLQYLRLPGLVAGLGPIQAAQAELAGALDVREYASNWFTPGEADVPSGVLKTDQPLTSDQAKAYKQMWNDTADGGVRILGGGLTYTPMMLKPADAQWLEVQQFGVTGIARLFGIPASLMLAAVEGTSMTYTNVEQAWIEFVRFTLMTYLREIEEAFTACLPTGQTARFNVEGLLRTDTKTRLEAHQIAINAGIYSPEYAALIEKVHGDPGTPIRPTKKPAAQEVSA